jgi:hypothetical protein
MGILVGKDWNLKSADVCNGKEKQVGTVKVWNVRIK